MMEPTILSDVRDNAQVDWWRAFLLAAKSAKQSDWIGALLAIVGSYLLSFGGAGMIKWGWVAYVVSNLFWVSYGINNGKWSIIVMQVVFMVSSINGVFRNFS